MISSYFLVTCTVVKLYTVMKENCSMEVGILKGEAIEGWNLHYSATDRIRRLTEVLRTGVKNYDENQRCIIVMRKGCCMDEPKATHTIHEIGYGEAGVN